MVGNAGFGARQGAFPRLPALPGRVLRFPVRMSFGRGRGAAVPAALGVDERPGLGAANPSRNGPNENGASGATAFSAPGHGPGKGPTEGSEETE